MGGSCRAVEVGLAGRKSILAPELPTGWPPLQWGAFPGWGRFGLLDRRGPFLLMLWD